MILGALEAGGTKMVCAVGDENGTIHKTMTVPTLTPEETMPQILNFFKENQVEAVGVACFGPIDLNKNSSTYGYITSTPKKAWQYYDICGEVKRALEVPVGFDTDVNGSCLGELHYGAGKGLHSVVYITIGTGVGMGICVEGNLIHGMLHPEAGHMLVSRHPEDPFEGSCSFHKNCVEGMCSGPAIGARYNKNAVEIDKDDVAWDYTAYYIAQAIVNLVLTVSPQRVILGGGVMKQEHLFPMIRENVTKLLNRYVITEELKNMDTYIVAPECGDEQGVKGALMIAKTALDEA